MRTAESSCHLDMRATGKDGEDSGHDQRPQSFIRCRARAAENTHLFPVRVLGLWRLPEQQVAAPLALIVPDITARLFIGVHHAD